MFTLQMDGYSLVYLNFILKTGLMMNNTLCMHYFIMLLLNSSIIVEGHLQNHKFWVFSLSNVRISRKIASFAQPAKVSELMFLSYYKCKKYYSKKSLYLLVTFRRMKTKKFSHNSILIVLMLIAFACSMREIVHTRLLQWKDPFCTEWTDQSGSCCKTCSYHYWMDKHGKCQPVSDWCKTWDDQNGWCTSCFLGYGDPVKGVCAGGPPAHRPVSYPNQIEEKVTQNCKVYGYMDLQKKLYSRHFEGCRKLCRQCQLGYFLDNNYKCCTLPKNCKAIDQHGACTSCENGFHVEKGLCVKCKPLPQNCQAADQKGVCTSCEDGYHVEKGVCVANPVQDDHCAEYGYVDGVKKWYSYYAKGCKKVCKTCDSGYYLDCEYKCKPLPQNCQAADQKGVCTSCEDGYHVEKGVCVANPVQDDHCAEYGYVDGVKKWYSYYAKGCKKVCKTCDSGYYLDCEYKCKPLPQNCQAADQKGVCTSCDDGYHAEKGVCVANPVQDDHCAEYGYVDGVKKWYSYYAKGCKKVCKTCNAGYYIDSNYKCILLPGNCAVADVNGICTLCSTGYHLDKGICIVNLNDHCTEYGYLDGSDKWYSTYLKGCIKYCKQCQKGYYLDMKYTCQRLPQNCLCANAFSECNECVSGYKLNNKKCIKVSLERQQQNCSHKELHQSKIMHM